MQILVISRKVQKAVPREVEEDDALFALFPRNNSFINNFLNGVGTWRFMVTSCSMSGSGKRASRAPLMISSLVAGFNTGVGDACPEAFSLQLRGPFDAIVWAGFQRLLLSVPPSLRLLVLVKVFQ